MLTRTLAVIAGAAMLTASAVSLANAETSGRMEIRSPVDSGGGYQNDDDDGYGGTYYRPRPPVGWGGGTSFGLPRIEARVRYGNDWRDPQLSEAAARAQVIQAWRTKVSYRFGERFSRWRMAQDKYVDCSRGRGSVTCIASARPQGGWGRWRRWGWNSGY